MDGPGAGQQPLPPVSPYFTVIVTVLAVVLGLWFLQPLLFYIYETIRYGTGRVDKDALRKKREQHFRESDSDEMSPDGKSENKINSRNRTPKSAKQNGNSIGGKNDPFSGLSNKKCGSVDCSDHFRLPNDELKLTIETMTENLKSIGLELIKEDSTLSIFSAMCYIIDNAILKNYRKIPQKADRLQREVLKFQRGQDLIEMCGFVLEAGSDQATEIDGGDGDGNVTEIAAKVARMKQNIKDKNNQQMFYVLKDENKLSAVIARSCLQFVLEVSKACGGNRRWLELEASILVPEDVKVYPRDILYLYCNATRMASESSGSSSTRKVLPCLTYKTNEVVTDLMKEYELDRSHEHNKSDDEKSDALFIYDLLDISGCFTLVSQVAGEEPLPLLPSLEPISYKEANLEAAILDNVLRFIFNSTTRNTRQSCPNHSLLQAAARVFVQKRRACYRRYLWEEQKLKYSTDPEQTKKLLVKDRGQTLMDDYDGKKFWKWVADHSCLPNNLRISYFTWEGEIPHCFGLQSSKGGTDKQKGFGPPTGDAKDVAMGQIAKEALPIWKLTPEWKQGPGRANIVRDPKQPPPPQPPPPGSAAAKAKAKQDAILIKKGLPTKPDEDMLDIESAVSLLSIGGSLDYTNNRGFVCLVIAGAIDSGPSCVGEDLETGEEVVDYPSLFGPLKEDEEEARRKCLAGEHAWSSDRGGAGSKKSALLRGADNPFHVSNMKQSEWDKRSFGAKVKDKNGDAKMKQKSGF